MPKFEQTIAVENFSTDDVLATCLSVFNNLNWPVQHAGPNALQGNTPKNWSTKPLQILAVTDGNTLMVSSETISGESFDLGGKNKKNVASFLTQFEQLKNSISADELQQNKNAIASLQQATLQAVEEEEKNTAEIDKAMNLSSSNLYATYAIMGINVLVFILMIINGAGLIDTNGLVHIKWGSNFTALTTTGDWWRLLTNVFIHFGIIHIAMNLYCLYTIGIYLEPMLGKAKYITAYLCTGILASIVSIWWHKNGVNSAGASGAIFGLYGLFFALLTTNLIPKTLRMGLLQSIGIFIVFNLFSGMKSGIDNSAHVGGLLSGFVIGYIYALTIKKEKEGVKLSLVIPFIVLATLTISYFYLNSHKGSMQERKAVLNEIADAGFSDTEKFKEVIKQFGELEDKAIAPINDTTLTNVELKNKIKNICSPSWDIADSVLKETQNYKLSPSQLNKSKKLLEYVALRKRELALLEKMIAENSSEKYLKELDKVRVNMNKIVEDIQKL